MDIPTALLYTIISTVAEMAMTPSADSQSAYETAAIARTLPPEAKQGVMQPPAGDGFLNPAALPVSATVEHVLQSIERSLDEPFQTMSVMELAGQAAGHDHITIPNGIC